MIPQEKRLNKVLATMGGSELLRRYPLTHRHFRQLDLEEQQTFLALLHRHREEPEILRELVGQSLPLVAEDRIHEHHRFDYAIHDEGGQQYVHLEPASCTCQRRPGDQTRLRVYRPCRHYLAAMILQADG